MAVNNNMGGDTSRVRHLKAEVAGLQRRVNELTNAAPYAARAGAVPIQRHPERMHPQDEAYRLWKRMGVEPAQIQAFRTWKRMGNVPR